MKELTGKAREDFFEWLYLKKGIGAKLSIYQKGDIQGWWFLLLQSAQFGLIQEWGDSVGLICRTDYGEERFSSDKSLWFETSIVNNNLKRLDQKKFWASGCLNSRPEAQREAVKKLSEIYNK